MHKKLFLTLPFICSIFLIPSTSDSREITTIGSRDCKTWIEDRVKEKNAELTSSNYLGALFNRTWLLGVLTGLNANNYPYKKDLLNDLDKDLIVDWMDRYCQNNKSSNVFQGAQRLMDDLDKIITK